MKWYTVWWIEEKCHNGELKSVGKCFKTEVDVHRVDVNKIKLRKQRLLNWVNT